MSFLKTLTAAALTLVLPPLLVSTELSPAFARVQNKAAATEFLELYYDYINVTNKEQANGLRKIAVADFAIPDESTGKTLRGEEAFTYAAKIYDATNVSQNHVIRFHMAKVTDQYAVIYAEEAITRSIDVKDSLNPEQRAMGFDTTARGTAKWRWKHTWRKTPQGWKLASLSRDRRPKPERHDSYGLSYSVGIKPSSGTVDKSESTKP
jgi:hypothetical protein